MTVLPQVVSLCCTVVNVWTEQLAGTTRYMLALLMYFAAQDELGSPEKYFIECDRIKLFCTK